MKQKSSGLVFLLAFAITSFLVLFAHAGSVLAAPPTITLQPTGKLIQAGASVTFTATAAGTEPISYQWRRNGFPVAGANNPTLTLNNVQIGDAGTYSLLVTSASGMALSLPAILTVSRTSPPSAQVAGWRFDGYGKTGVPWDLTNAVAVSGGVEQVLALRADGTVATWGLGYNGQGDIPASATNIVAVAVGIYHSLALKNDGTVIGWGKNDMGQAIPPTGLNGVVAIAAGGQHSIALRGDGTVVAWGLNDTGQCRVPTGLSNVVAIAGGATFSVALKRDGRVVSWGPIRDQSSQDIGRITAGFTNLVQVSAKFDHVLALQSNGAVIAWGANYLGQTNVPPGLNNVTLVAAGSDQSLALRSDGTVVGWGSGMTGSRDSDYGQAHVPDGMTGVSVIDAAANCSFAIMSGLPAITLHPDPQRIAPGGLAEFRAWAVPLNGMTYQWQFNGANIPGKDGWVLTVTNARASDLGAYTAIASNALGTTRSQIATLEFYSGKPGALDPSYVTTGSGSINGFVESLVLQSDGKAIVGGFFTQMAGAARNRLARLNQDGSLDDGFDIGTGADDTVSALAVQGDGKILIAGRFTQFNGTARPYLARLNANGTLDSTFLNGLAGPNAPVECLLVEPEGTLLIGGEFTRVNGINRGRLARLKADGSLDTQFLNSMTGADGTVRVLTRQPNGKLLVFGDGWNFNGQGVGRGARLNANGSLDTTFVPTVGMYPQAAVLQLDGKIVLGGTHPEWPNNHLYLTRLNANGSVDPTFNTTNLWTSVNALLLQSDGKILVGFDGGSGFHYYERAGILRLNTDGSVDTGFDPGSYLARSAMVRDLALQPDGRILIAGGFEYANGYPRDSVARLIGGDLPTITLAPRTQTVFAGTVPVLSVGATGQQPLSYQWQRGGINIPGATNSFLFLRGATPDMSGNYTVLVTTPAGAVASASATLTVQPATTGATAAWFGARVFDYPMVPPDWSNLVAVAHYSGYRLGLRNDGTLVGEGYPGVNPPIPGGLSNVVAIVAGWLHGLALKQDGTVQGWGDNSYGQSQPPAGLNDVVAIAGSQFFSLALKSDGKVVGWGDNTVGQVSPPPGLTGVVAITAGEDHGLALKADGTVVGWGNNQYGQATAPAGLSNVVSIATHGSVNLALKANGNVLGWGSDRPALDIPPSLTGVVAISVGDMHGLALKADGTVVAWGVLPLRFGSDYGESPAEVPPGLKDVISIDAGASANLVLIVGPPVITTPPVPQLVTTGGTANFYLNAYGPAPLGYQWYRDGLPVAAATNNLLIISNTLPAHVGNYHVVVTNPRGTATSQSVPLGLNTGEPGAVDLSFKPIRTPRYASLAAQPDGKIIVGGIGSSGSQDILEFLRLNADGSVDPTFATPNIVGGIVGAPYFRFTLALQPDGKVLIAGSFSQVNGIPRNSIARLNANGSLDTTFMSAGVGPNGQVMAVTLQADGKVLIGGSFTEVNGVRRGRIARLNADGTLDTTFLATGTGVAGEADPMVFALALQPDGKILAAGHFTTVNGVDRYRLARLNPNGTTDASFQSDVECGSGGVNIIVQPDGKIVVSSGTYGINNLRGNGFLRGPDGKIRFLARLNSNGSLDPNYDAAAGPYGPVWSIQRQPDGKLLVGGGFSTCGESSRWGIARLLPDGEVDPTFVEGGRPLHFPHDVWGIALTPEGGITIAGDFHVMNGYPCPSIARLYQGTLPTIVTQPASQRIVVGQSVTFSVTATNPARLYYQWQRNGLALTGATNTSLTVPNVQPANGGNYTVVVSNSTGSVTSQVAVLTPVIIPSPTAPLPTQIGHAGSNIVLSVSFNGTPPFNYQWRFNGVSIPGATDATLTLNNLADANSGHYSVVASNEAGSATSDPILLQVYYGSGYVYRWFYPNIPGANVSDLTSDPSFPTYPSAIEKMTNDLTGQVNADDTYGSLIQGYLVPPLTGNYTFWIAADDAAELWLSTSDAPANVQLTAFCLLPVAVNDWTASPEQQSAPIALTAGQRYYFEVVHKEGSGNDHVAVGWKRPDDSLQRPIPAAYLSPLVDPVTTPEIRQHPQSLVVVAGRQARFDVSAEGVPPLYYQWQRDGVNLPGKTNATLVLDDVRVSQNGAYRVVVTNKFGQATSDDASLVVHYALALTVLPGGIVNRNPDQPDYAPGTGVTLTAMPQAGHVFLGWSGDADSTNASIQVTLDANKDITALFAPTWTLAVTIPVAGGQVIRQPDQAQYVDGTLVQIEAQANAGFVFTGWSGDTNTTANRVTLMMDRNRSLQANFQQVFYLSASVSGEGTVTVEPQKAYYLPGESVSLTAVPAPGFGFIGWSGDNPSAAAAITVTMNANASLTATFKRIVNLVVTPTGQGSVMVEPQATTYLEGAVVQLTATASAGWQFIEWTGALTGSQNPAALTLDTDKQVAAVFKQLFKVTTEVIGRGTVTVVPKLEQYAYGTTVTVVASAPSGYRFVSWGGDLSGTNTPAALMVDGDKHVIATFLPLWSLEVTASPGGSVAKEPDLARYVDGTEVLLSAVANGGYGFAGWSGDTNATTNMIVIRMDTNKTVHAEFKRGWVLTAQATEGGSIERSPDLAVYPGGSAVTLTAQPAADYVFVQWTGDVVGTANPRSVTMERSMSVTAHFVRAELQPPTIDAAQLGMVAEGFRLTIKGRAGTTLIIETSEDLEHWITLHTLTMDGTPSILLDVGAPGKAARFYRLRQAP